MSNVDGFPLTADQINNWTQWDPVLAHVKEYLLHGWPQVIDNPELILDKAKREELNVQDGYVLWVARVVIPAKGWKLVLAELLQAHPVIC